MEKSLLTYKKGGSLKALQQLSSLDVGCLGDLAWIVGYILSIFIETEAMPLFNMMNPDPIQTREFGLPVPLDPYQQQTQASPSPSEVVQEYPQDPLWDELEKQERKKREEEERDLMTSRQFRATERTLEEFYHRVKILKERPTRED